LPRIVRLADGEDVARDSSGRRRARDAQRIAVDTIRERRMPMKVVKVDVSLDGGKATITFFAENRVDFRELVRDLARTFRTRIELRQIGVRDEAALLGGVGRCGRELCCSTWLRELKPVSLQLAKDQRLSLNPAQISGCCGRLMCCLTYEHDSYVQARKRFPREGKSLRTSRGREKVVSVDIWRERVLLKDEDGNRRTIALEELKAEVAAAGDEPEAPERGGDAPSPAETQAGYPYKPRRTREDNGRGTGNGGRRDG
jgi:cell fate regulator YaaT (PSP1 superfamily)